ncbi:MAG: FAD-dependent oxidoreductase [Hyphomicrobium sp.]|nr:FAD-dependent oxidoreductase [Hyphomicrobium sp.]
MTRLSATIVGGGIFGLWQAYELARRGHDVTLYEAMSEAETGGASRFAGAMLAPYCEAEGAEPIVQELGVRGLALWRKAVPQIVMNGSLVVAASRDQGELARFARMTEGHRAIDGSTLGELEPELGGRFGRALWYPDEGHMEPRLVLAFLTGEIRRLGGTLHFGSAVPTPVWRAGSDGGVVIDCRGLAAREDLPTLRGVRGEMAVLRSREVKLTRPIRLLHPRFALYVVPWSDNRYMIGATVIEREDAGPVTVRSALDLLGTAYALHPGFGEAEILELSAGVRPAFPDNVPRIVAKGRRLLVNGAFRHGYLLAPVMAEIAATYLETGAAHPILDVD